MDEQTKKTALYDLHLESDARMVPFAGYDMPVQYSDGIRHEHVHTRRAAGLFDVSHMGQIIIHGDNAAASIERLVTGDISALKDFEQCYTLFTNNAGGIVDDLMLTKTPDYLSLVVNAACKEADYQYLKASLPPECQIEMLFDQALLALQGPLAVKVLGCLNSEISKLAFLTAAKFELDGIPCFINRSGYTGEDGFEISLRSEQAEQLARLLLNHDEVELAGLGARDSLRLEAGLCLYGHDIDNKTTPIEAGLNWVIAKKYRDGSVEAKFPGAEKILQQLQAGPEKIRCGLLMQGKLPVREGTAILNIQEEKVGNITSGGFGPSVEHPVAMGYVEKKYADIGSELQVEIRQRFHPVQVVQLPFMNHRYFKS